MATKCVCVWLDKTGEPSDPKWIVSRDRLDDAGRAETTSTLAVFDEDDEEGAIEEGRKQAKKLGLPLYRNPENGPAELVEG